MFPGILCAVLEFFNVFRHNPRLFEREGHAEQEDSNETDNRCPETEI